MIYCKKTTFGSQSSSENDLKYHINSIKYQKPHLPTNVLIQMSKGLFLHKEHLQKRRSFMFFFLVFIRVFKTVACYKITYRWLNLDITQLSATRLKTHRLFQVDIDRREQCCAANYEQVVNHVVPSCYS